MKLRLVVGILGILLFAFIGSTNIIKLTDDCKTMDTLTTQLSKSRTVYEDLYKQSNELLTKLEASGRSKCLDNVLVAETISNMKGGELQEIKALGDVDGVTGDILVTKTVNDVAFFGDDVTEVVYTLSITEQESFLQSLKELDLIIDEFHVDLNKDTAIITIPVISALLNNSGNDNNNLQVESTQDMIDENTESDAVQQEEIKE